MTFCSRIRSVVLVPCKFGRLNLVSVLVSSTETIFGARGFGCRESVELFDFAFSVILCKSVCRLVISVKNDTCVCQGVVLCIHTSSLRHHLRSCGVPG